MLQVKNHLLEDIGMHFFSNFCYHGWKDDPSEEKVLISQCLASRSSIQLHFKLLFPPLIWTKVLNILLALT